MLVPLVALLLQITTPAPDTGVSRDSARVVRRASRTDRKRAGRVTVTADHLATAFDSPAAREILALARRARATQDSTLQSYDASTYQRISAGLALTKFGRDRLAFRTESSTRVQWRRGIGAYVEVTGSRSVLPIGGRSGRVSAGASLSPVPYYPGSETILAGFGGIREEIDENEGLVHPLAPGSEAYFTYEAGDSVSFRLPDGRSIRLRELRVRPRVPKWNLAVGSLWFDMSGGQLVRAAYRMAVPMDISEVALEDDPTAFDEVPVWLKPMMFPMKAEVGAIGVEYGLYQGRFWLPRLQVIEGGAQAGPIRIPFKLEQRFSYTDVNAGTPLPSMPPVSDSSRSHSEGVSLGMDVGPSRARTGAHCDSAGMHRYRRNGGDPLHPVLLIVPCDSAKLANSPDLPPSIYAEGEEAFPKEELDALVNQALSMGAQASFAPQLPTFELETPRYNRIEGPSFGGRVDQQLGAGYSVHGVGRLGLADFQPVVELTGARSDLRRTLAITAYNRLVSAGDYGSPFGVGSSLSALLFARDEAYYYRASGVELASSPDQPGGRAWSWALFAEQERTARRKTTFALAPRLAGFTFDTNLVATRGPYLGARTRLVSTFGRDPEGFRLLSDLRLEAAHGDTGTYGRAALDLTLSRAIGRGAAALTLAGGTSAGVLPVQRNWFVGGSQTVRGERAALEPGRMGDAFWLARGELARGLGVVRPVLFADFGWAGDRTKLREVGRPVSGAGVGMSVMDGLLRFDVARGINPDRAWRVYTYVEGRF